MKSKFLKSSILESKQRYVALLFFVWLGLFSTTLGAAQLRTQRRVTALQLADAAEGSRVTVVSDSALNDYEAFRRGDRFYVKIPLAEFTSGVPHFRADGFEDVQVQRVGDSLIVSFKLQPGATARVDQHGNRLDVIFSAANKSSYNNTANAGANRDPSRDGGPDAAGPMPPGSLAGSRDRVVTYRSSDGNYGRTPQNSSLATNAASALNANSRKSAKPPATASSSVLPTPSPVSSPRPVLTPTTSSVYSPLTTATPTASPTTLIGSSSASAVAWKQRGSAALRWASANRLATLLGALILLSLIAYLAMAWRSRQTQVVKAKSTKAPKVQPKYSPDDALNELSRPSVDEQTPAEVKKEPSAPPATSAPAAANAAHDHQWLTGPNIASPPSGHDEHSSEEEEREVFEL